MALTLSHLVSVACVLHVFIVPAASCPPQCHSCTGSTAICGQAGLRDIPQNFPDDVVVLDFTGNHITVLNRGSFPPLTNVQSLRIPNNGISEISEGSFTNIPHLTMIDLSSNALSRIDDGAFRGLDQMSSLTLTSNRLQHIGRSLEGMASLSSLHLGFNQLTEIEEDDFQFNTMLRILDLSNNMIRQIHPMAFKNLKRLRYLSLRDNALSHKVEFEFSTTMLQLVDFTKSQLKQVPKGMPSSVAEIRLGNNMITEISDDDFKDMTNLRLLMMDDNLIHNISDRAFKPLENLKEMWLSQNELFFIPHGLPPNLETLYMDNNRIYTMPSRLFRDDSKLKVLSLEMNKIVNISSDAFKGLENLEQINLQFNRISEIRTRTFSHLPALTVLQLSYNPITVIEQGAFQNLPKLNSLSMSNVESPNVYITESFLSSISDVNSLKFMNSPGLVSSLLATISHSSPAANLDQVKTINLQYNELTTLSGSLRRSLKNVERVFLDGNPFHCDKRLIWLKEWMLEEQVTFHSSEESECATPFLLQGQKIKNTPRQSFVNVAPEILHGTRQVQPDAKIARLSLPGSVISPSALAGTGQRRAGDVSRSASRHGTPITQRIQEAPVSVRTDANRNPNTRRKLQTARKKGRRGKGKKRKNRKNNKNKKGKKRRGKRHNRKGGRRRCKKLSDGSVKCRRRKCKTMPDGKVRCRRPRNKKKVRNAKVISTSS